MGNECEWKFGGDWELKWGFQNGSEFSVRGECELEDERHSEVVKEFELGCHCDEEWEFECKCRFEFKFTSRSQFCLTIENVSEKTFHF
jgi:hypothetical protein